MGSRHGRATFSVLLFQDLAVVVLLMLIPLLAPDANGQTNAGFKALASALGLAAMKAVICIGAITAGGRLFIRPLYKKISQLANAEIFAATTLLVVLGTSLMTQLAGLSLALGAFLAGLLLAETEYVLQVESDIAPYKGLLLGLFFMTVGMQISVGLFLQQWRTIVAAIVILIGGKLGVMCLAGQMFGLSRMAALRAGLLLASGGEFAFVAFGEAVSKGVLPVALTSQVSVECFFVCVLECAFVLFCGAVLVPPPPNQNPTPTKQNTNTKQQQLYLVVALSMALTPYLAALGGKLGGMFGGSDIKALQPQESEVSSWRACVLAVPLWSFAQWLLLLRARHLSPLQHALNHSPQPKTQHNQKQQPNHNKNKNKDQRAAQPRHHRRLRPRRPDHRADALRALDPLRCPRRRL